MQDVVESGTGQRVKQLGRPVAGKTGTTDDTRDAWFMGFTPSLVAGVWVGFDQERPMGRQEVGGRAAAPIWLYFAEKALEGTPVELFPVPEGIVFAKVDPKTGAPAKPSTKGAIFECFLEGTTPEERRNRGPGPPPRRRLQVRHGPEFLKSGINFTMRQIRSALEPTYFLLGIASSQPSYVGPKFS